MGVLLVAALAWYVGRASLHHRIMNGGTSTACNVFRPRSGKFSHCFRRSGATEMAPVTPAMQIPMNEGGYLPGLDRDTQQQSEHQEWPMMSQKEPFMKINEEVTPAPRYVTSVDGYSTLDSGTGETDAMRNYTGWQALRYEGVGFEQAEGLGLLNGGNRPVMKRKEISRKPLPAHSHWDGRS